MIAGKHEAILALDPNVKMIIGDVAYDGSGNVVSYDSTAVENQANLITLRRERDARLAATDWWACSDLTMTSEQVAYRQALRDITNSYTSLSDVVWPEKPE